MKPGSGKIVVNKKDHAEYFARPVLQMILKQPLQVTDRLTQFDVMATVSGGGSVRPGRRRTPRSLQGT